jgi:hypothetical protein
MCRRILVPVLLLCAAGAAAQTGVGPDAPAGVTVEKFSWQNMTYRQGWDAPTESAADQSMADPRISPTSDPGSLRLPTPLGTTLRRPREPSEENRRASSPINTEPSPTSPSAPKGRVEEYNYRVKIKNAGEATIEAVEWDYLFLEPGVKKELARHRFQSFRRAKPGKSLTLNGTSNAPPTKVVSAAGAGGNGRKLFEEKIVIRCVAYADGTVRWRAAGAESDCDGIRERTQARRD